MRNSDPIRRSPQSSEEGYLLLAVMFLMALLALSLAVAAPSIAKSIQRDREVETMERGKQYIRAIQLYYRKFHAYPPNIDALVKTNDIRFLRQRYIDPMTGKDDWKPILYGQNKTPTAMGFFGQPLSTGGSVAGIGPAGGNGLNGANGAASSGGLFNSAGGSGLGASPGAGGTSIGGSSIGGSSIFGSSGLGTSPTPTAGSTDSSTGSSTNGTGANGANSSGGTSAGSTDANGNPTSGGTGTGLAGQTGQTFGGAGIIGFSPASPKQSILIYKKKDHYNEWEFTYDPIMEMMMAGGGGNTGTIGQPAGGASGVPGFGNTNSQGPNNPGLGAPAGAGSGAGGGTGPAPTTPPETPAPQ